MDELAVVAWFEDVATHLKAIGHSEAASRFARNRDELSEGLQKKIPCLEFTLCMEDPRGSILDGGEKFGDRPTVSFMILKHVKTNDWRQEDEVYAAAKSIYYKIMSKALHDRELFYEGGAADSVMRHYQSDESSYRKEIIPGHDLVGVHASFVFYAPVDKELAFAESDWSYVVVLDSIYAVGETLNWIEPVSTLGQFAVIGQSESLTWIAPVSSLDDAVEVISIAESLTWLETASVIGMFAVVGQSESLIWIEPVSTIGYGSIVSASESLNWIEADSTIGLFAIVTQSESLTWVELVSTIGMYAVESSSESLAWVEPVSTVGMFAVVGQSESLTWIEPNSDILIRLIHLEIVAQSQGGGYLASPALTTDTDANVLTLTNGPLDSDTTSGELVLLSEGDTYDNGGSDSDVETMASALARQLLSFIGNDFVKVAVTVHYHGGSSIQDLDKGGANESNGYLAAVAAAARVKNRAEALGYTYERHFIVSHGGSGANPYGAGFASLVNNLVADTVGDNTPMIWADQQRVIGTPDFGQQIAELVGVVPNLKVILPRVAVVEGLNDGYGHLTNHDTRLLAMYYAIAAYDDLYGTGHEPLTLDVANMTLVNGVLILSVLGGENAIVGAVDFNLIVTDETNGNVLGGTWVVNGANIEFPISSNLPNNETVDISIASGYGSGSLRDSRGNAGVIFNDDQSNPYTLYKHVLRETKSKSLAFPAIVVPPAWSGRVLINLAGGNTVSSPDVNGRYWNNITSNATNKNASTDGFVFGSTIIDTDGNDTALTFEMVTAVDGNYGDQAGRNQGGGTNATVGDYVSPAGLDSWFTYPAADQVGGVWEVGGVDDQMTLKIKLWGSRAATGTRSIDVATQPDFSDSQSFVSDNNVDPDQNSEFTISGVSSQKLYIRSTAGGSDFGYISVIDIEEII